MANERSTKGGTSRSTAQARVSSPVPNPDVRCWQRQGAKLGIPPKGRASHPHNPGQGKIGLGNASERSTRLRKYCLPERWLTKTAMMGPGAGTDICPAGRHPTPEYRAHLLQSQLTSVERGNPNGVWSHHASGGGGQPPPYAPVGTGRSQKRRPPAERHGKTITRWIGYLPTLKGG